MLPGIARALRQSSSEDGFTAVDDGRGIEVKWSGLETLVTGKIITSVNTGRDAVAPLALPNRSAAAV